MPDVAILHQYISGYAGHAKVARLLHVAQLPVTNIVKVESLRLAAQELRDHSVNTKLYISVCDDAQNSGATDVTADEEWVAKVSFRKWSQLFDPAHPLSPDIWVDTSACSAVASFVWAPAESKAAGMTTRSRS